MISYAKFHLGKKADNISDLFPQADPFHFFPKWKKSRIQRFTHKKSLTYIMSIFSNGSNIFSKGNRAQERQVFTATDCRSHVYTNLGSLIQGQMQDNKGSHSKNTQIFRHYGTL